MEEKELQDLLLTELPKSANLRPLKGFKLDFSGNKGFTKIFFSVPCDCETAALISVEIDEGKSDQEIHEALPFLTKKLTRQEDLFRSMDCSMHSMMRQGRVPGSK